VGGQSTGAAVTNACPNTHARADTQSGANPRASTYANSHAHARADTQSGAGAGSVSGTTNTVPDATTTTATADGKSGSGAGTVSWTTNTLSAAAATAGAAARNYFTRRAGSACAFHAGIKCGAG
jgi:hypothetical protein